MVKEEQLKKVTTEILTAYGEDKKQASLVADVLVKADLRGINTHGTYLLIPIFDRVKAGMLNIPTKITIIKEKGAITLLDGGNGLG